MKHLDALLDERRIVVCVGTGGVGKTTVSSALALRAARRGRRALVLTIDPARRLADALGLERLDAEPERLSRAHERELGIESPGTLSAMMLDMKGTFDALVERLCENTEVRDRIFENPLYQHVSDALAGSVEYAAMEKVYELSRRTEFDVIIVDTPPAQHALDFLDAPERLVILLDSSIVRLLVQPAFQAGRLGFRLFHGAAERGLELLERVSGVSFLKDISEFLLAIESLKSGFKARAGEVRTLLRGPDSTFLLIAGPAPDTAAAAGDLIAQLESTGIELGGLVLNRVHEWPDGAPWHSELVSRELGDRIFRDEIEALASRLDEGGCTDASSAAHAAARVTRDYALRVAADAKQMRRLAKAALQRGRPMTALPAMPVSEDETSTLRQLADALGRQAGAQLSADPKS